MDNFDPELYAEAIYQELKAKNPSELAAILPLSYGDLYISTKEAGLKRFYPNSIQAAFNDNVFGDIDWRTCAVGLSGVRRIILKSRQLGFSTNTVGLYFMDTLHTGYKKTIIMAHDLPSTVELFKKVRLMYEMLPVEVKKRFGKPGTASKYELFWPEIQASILVGTAGSADFGASQTVNNVLLTEIPRWPDGAMQAVADGLMNAVPMGGNIIIESTARGVGNDFHRRWLEAMSGRSVFRPLFYSWKDFPEYQLTPNQWHMLPTEFIPEDISDEELGLMRDWKLTINQIAWRRWKIAELESEDLFAQNFPLYWQEAFRTSGMSYFNNKKLGEELARIEQVSYGNGVDYVSAFA
jgi:hypothetical protein